MECYQGQTLEWNLLKKLESVCLVHIMKLWNLNEILVNDQNTLFENFETEIQVLSFRMVVRIGGVAVVVNDVLEQW